MKVISPSVEVWPVDSTSPQSLMKHIEGAGRVCYKSEDRITDGSSGSFVRSVIERGHTAVLEHGNLILYANADTESYIHALRDVVCFDQFMRMSHVLDPVRQLYKGIYVSGNIRAWREVIETGLKGNLWIPSAMEAILGQYGVLFEDLLNINRLNKPGWERPVYSPIECYIVDQRNLQPFERLTHAAYTVKFVCDRGVTHEIVRHRLASYCQESTRYCNYSKGKFNGELTFIRPCFFNNEKAAKYVTWSNAMKLAEKYYLDLLEFGATPQEARTVLPNSLKAELVMSARADEWLWFFKLRTAEAAHPQMQEVAKMAKGLLFCTDPDVFGVDVQ